jgi:hypothetical protein
MNFQWSFGFDIRIANARLQDSRMSNPLHWNAGPGRIKNAR